MRNDDDCPDDYYDGVIDHDDRAADLVRAVIHDYERRFYYDNVGRLHYDDPSRDAVHPPEQRT